MNTTFIIKISFTTHVDVEHMVCILRDEDKNKGKDLNFFDEASFVLKTFVQILKTILVV